MILLYLNKIKNRITFRIKTGYFLELLRPEMTTCLLLGSAKSNVTKDISGEYVPRLEIT